MVHANAVFDSAGPVAARAPRRRRGVIDRPGGRALPRVLANCSTLGLALYRDGRRRNERPVEPVAL